MFFGVYGALVFINLIHPLVTKLLGKALVKIPLKVQKIAINSLIVLLCIDTLASSIGYLHIGA